MAPKGKRGARATAELQSDQTIAETITDQTIVGTLAADGVTDAVATMTVDEDPLTGFFSTFLATNVDAVSNP
jgi:hypothetical protein